jgi:hypothetical protein
MTTEIKDRIKVLEKELEEANEDLKSLRIIDEIKIKLHLPDSATFEDVESEIQSHILRGKAWLKTQEE